MEWRQTLVLGCGNVLFGDDGFGPAVVERCLARFAIPESVCLIDAGTSARDILFDVLLSEKKPSRIVILDAVDCGLAPGELCELDVDHLPQTQIDDFSLHQIPASNLLRELRDLSGVEVAVLACQVAEIPAVVRPGLSPAVSAAVERAVDMLGRTTLRPEARRSAP